MNKSDIIKMLSLTDKAEIEHLYKEAYKVKKENVGTVVYFRGIIELSNLCTKNCFYCGIRRDNANVTRYSMTDEEVYESAVWSWEQGYGSMVIQSGEREDREFVDRITNLLLEIKKRTNGELGITLSLGEHDIEVFKQWYDAGAHRYLLRIETSNPDLYKKLHPADHDWYRRIQCLRDLKSLGYQVGTGVMIGLPYQTVEDLADDVLFFQREDIDMIGMGPFIPHPDTPFASYLENYHGDDALERALKMIAVCRIYLKDINIASTTALQALNPTGREMGLLAGANIIMPNITDTKYRANYKLYDGKPCLDENASLCRGCLEKRISSIGESIGYNKWGDSIHWTKRKGVV